MEDIALQIENIEEQIAYTYSELRDYYISLGNHICINQNEMQIPLSVKYRESIDEIREKYLLLQHKKEQREIVLEELALGKESLRILKNERIKKEKDFNLIKRRLGALSFEQAQADVLSEEVRLLLKNDLDKVNNINQLLSSNYLFKRLLGRMKSKKHKRQLDSFYEAITDKLFNNNSLLKLRGERGQSLVSEYNKLKLDIQTIDEEVLKFKSTVTTRKATIEKETNDIEKELEKTKDSWDEEANKYGTYLMENAVKWIGENTSDRVLDFISKTMECQDTIANLQNEIKKKKRQIEIDDLRALIDRDKSAIVTLENERARLFNQIKGIEEEILSLNHKIKKLEQN